MRRRFRRSMYQRTNAKGDDRPPARRLTISNRWPTFSHGGWATTTISSKSRIRILNGTSPLKGFASARMQMPVTRMRAPTGTSRMGGSGSRLQRAGMAHDGGEEVAIGFEHVLVLCGLPNLGHHLAFHGNQIENATVTVVAAQGEIPPGEERWRHRRLHQAVAVLRRGSERQEAIFDGRESDRIRDIAHAQRAPAIGVDPETS